MATIQSTGIGSGLNVSGIISKLMEAESAPLVKLAQKQASYQADLTAYGSLQGSLSSLQSSLSILNNPSTFKTLTANVGDNSIFNATASSTASAGTYNISVSQLAQAQTISTPGQASTTGTIGGGTSTTLTFQFGTISGGTSTGGVYSGASFTQDAAQASGTVTIDSSNNSLQGIRDAINNAKVGVQASIVGDGSATPYHLVLTSAKTGQTSSMKISVAGDAALQSLLSYDPAGTQNLTELTTSQNAKLTVNGIAVSSASNSVNTAIQGVTLNAFKVGTTSLTVSNNTTNIQSAVTSFVSAYNNLQSTLGTVTAYNPTTKAAGALLGDSTTQTIQNQIRSVLSSAVNGLGGNLTYLAQVGISFQRDGTLAVDNSKLQTALTSNFSELAGLFTAAGKSSDSLVSFVGSTNNSTPGTYPVKITQMATQGVLTGDLDLSSGPTTIASGTSIKVTIDGISADVGLTAGSYTASGLASMIQAAVNGTSSFSSAGLSVSASITGSGFLSMTSASFGSTSKVTLADKAGTSVSQLTGTVTTGSAGMNVAGTINGVGATGSGQILTGSTGTAVEGLQILVTGGSTGDRGSISFSKGYAHNLNQTLSSILGTKGTLSNATEGINSSIKDLQKQSEVVSKRLTQVQARYQAQFAALDKVIANLNATQTYLTQQINVLNGSSTK
ncbi:flagellar filament capping protein FliD [Undibacterium luofuense]|uniref:flagellar filament capping protein FliD n=1 Tax=Undibacterium luofuense TaxID=2828733 RepID=UPI0030EF4A90